MAKGKLKALLEKAVTDRPKPSSTRAGQRPKSGSRYNGGGKVTRKKAV